MSKLRIVYGVNPFGPPRSANEKLAMSCSYVYLIGCNGKLKLLSGHDDTDTNNRSTSWKNDCLTIARESAKNFSKFYGIKPERLENHLVVPRAYNYSISLSKVGAK